MDGNDQNQQKPKEKISDLTIISERINCFIPSIGILLDDANASGDFSRIEGIAKEQAAAGVTYLDVNVDTLPNAMMARIVNAIQGIVDVPLCIDSVDPSKLAAGLMAYDYKKANGIPPILNSATESKSVEIFPLRQKRDCGIVLMLSETGTDVDGLFYRALDAGFEPEQVYLDPSIIPFYADYEGGLKRTLDTLERVSSNPDMVHSLIGLTNFVQGLPREIKKKARLPLQNALLTLAMERGLDTIIGDPEVPYKKLGDGDETLVTLKTIASAKDMSDVCHLVLEFCHKFEK
ncbi:MAG: dihydropteroate synthase [Nanoarchaeota archaeon]|nr:dihydropteroate synthase [Nanoarchaeota archaeon]